jgi:hypothetical protein
MPADNWKIARRFDYLLFVSLLSRSLSGSQANAAADPEAKKRVEWLKMRGVYKALCGNRGLNNRRQPFSVCLRGMS